MAGKRQKTKLIGVHSDKVKEILGRLHLMQLEDLEGKLREGILEPQEHRLIWDMVQKHQIGIESVDDIVDKATQGLEDTIGDIEVDDTFRFGD